jgi:8-oxo-dGTP diphosphatase
MPRAISNAGRRARSRRPRGFPVVRWGAVLAAFAPSPPPAGDGPAWAVVVFVWCRSGFVVADVPRGWCTPSGRLEPGETPADAAIRETREEIGAEIDGMRLIGHYRLVRPGEPPVLVPAYVGTTRAYGSIPPGSESRGARCLSMAELPALYWTWDALMARMFRYAQRRLADAGRAGMGRLCQPPAGASVAP